MPTSPGSDLARRLGRLRGLRLAAAGGEVVDLSAVSYLRYYRRRDRVLAFLDDGTTRELSAPFAELEERVPARFFACHSYYLVDLEKVRAVAGARGRYELRFAEGVRPARVSRAFEGRLEEALGVRNLDHPVPDHPVWRRRREHALLEFGEHELAALDRDDPPAVEAFTARWDVGEMAFADLERYFRYPSSKNLNMTQLVRNLVWQRYRWIQEGLAPQHIGNVRTFWYEVEAMVNHHEELEDGVVSSTFDAALRYLAAEEQLLKFRDIGFMDIRQPFRMTGATRPHYLLVSEKMGNFANLMPLAMEFGMGCAITRGQPAHIMMEYLGDELRAAGVDLATTPLYVFMIADFDWAGEDILEKLVGDLKRLSGASEVRFFPLIRREHFGEEEILRARTRGVYYTVDEAGREVPWPRRDFGSGGDPRQADLTKGLRWFKKVKDPIFRTKKKIRDEWVYTIWKFSADAIDWEKKGAIFRRAVAEAMAEEAGRSQGAKASAEAEGGARGREAKAPVPGGRPPRPKDGEGRVTLAQLALWSPRLPRDPA